MTGFDLLILGYPWRVCYKTPEEINRRAKKTGHKIKEGFYGMCFDDTREIWIDNTADAVRASSTVLHEVIHAIDGHLGLELTEAQVRGLETGLFTLHKKREQS